MIIMKTGYFAVLVFMMLFRYHEASQCEAELVETRPDGMEFESGPYLKSIADTWTEMFSKATSSIEISSFYWSMLCSDTENSIPTSCSIGEKVFEKIVEALKRNVEVKIVVNDNGKVEKNNDLNQLASHGAKIAKLNFTQLVGAGILHTKFILVDGSWSYLGSANMDWRALSEVKELGLATRNCPELVQDLGKIFKTYWLIALEGSIPEDFSSELHTEYNMQNPMSIEINKTPVELYISHSPPKMNAPGRTTDIDALIKVIDSAEQFLNIEVSEYTPFMIFSTKKFWPEIDNALRRAVYERNVNVNFLAGKWRFTRRNMILSLKSLGTLRWVKRGGSILVRMMQIPSTEEQAKVDHSRINNCKFAVTENTIYIGTSNWSGDYFVNAGGVGLTIIFKDPENELLKTLQNIHNRDWNSSHSFNISSIWR